MPQSGCRGLDLEDLEDAHCCRCTHHCSPFGLPIITPPAPQVAFLLACPAPTLALNPTNQRKELPWQPCRTKPVHATCVGEPIPSTSVANASYSSTMICIEQWGENVLAVCKLGRMSMSVQSSSAGTAGRVMQHASHQQVM